MAAVKDMRPDAFTIDDLDDDLSSMTLIRALPSESYGSFRSALMLLPDAKMSTLREAFQMEEQNRRPSASALALAASASSICFFCSGKGHLQVDCSHYKAAQQKFQSDKTGNGKAKWRRKGKGDNAKVATSTEKDTISSASNGSNNSGSNVNCAKEFAGNASTPSHATPSKGYLPSSDWNADTGATSHMTPHRHWFTTYTSYRTPIRLANDHIVYSAGLGSVRFQPMVNGKKERLLEFERVLHVPELQSNLLSVLYLTCKKDYIVQIVKDCMSFCQNGVLRFTATVNDKNTAYLDGYPIIEFAGAANASTCPLDVTLWHRRFGHLNINDMREIISKELVKGLDIKVSTPSDPICEPCIAGKLHRGPIPKVASHRSSFPLGLVHSDLHGPLPVQTREGYRYWITFIDDFSRFWVVVQLRKKSEAFDAFKRFKAYAENQLNRKIKALRDDKGGEYMSKEFDSFLASAGIARQHTVRNEPHQNGVAERANRTLSEGVTTMLVEAKLPASFWGFGLNAFVHVHNRSPTSAVADKTPYECWFKSKPVVSHFRVFGCLSYVHVQKDKRKGLEPHAQKAVFIGYPSEYKGWMFYNFKTKQTIISNTAVFDERHYPGTSTKPIDLTPSVVDSTTVTVPSPSLVRFEALEEGEDQVGVNRLSRDATLVAPAPPPPGTHVPPNPNNPGESRSQSEEPPQNQSELSPEPKSPSPPPPLPSHPPVASRKRPSGNIKRGRGVQSKSSSSSASSARRFPVGQPYDKSVASGDSLRRSSRVRQPPVEWWKLPTAVRNSTGTQVPIHDPSPSPSSSPDPLDIVPHHTFELEPTIKEETPEIEGDNDDNRDDDDDELEYVDSVDAVEELDDGHEDMHEIALQSSIEIGLGFMATEEVELSLAEALDFVLNERALSAEYKSDPKSLRDALNRDDAQHWWQAAINEIDTLIDNGTFIIREKRSGDKPVGARWVLRMKRNADGTIERYKARVVAKGYSQRPGYDYTETFAPTARWAALRAIFALAAIEDLEIESVDISSAFLNGDLKESITMEVFDGLHEMKPEIFPKKDSPKRHSDWVLELNKALYGLKQSPRMWHQKLHTAMTEMGFERVQCDNSIWVYLKDDTRVYVPVYVDDITVVSKRKAAIAWVKSELKKRFKLRDLGPTSFLLGVHVERNRSKRTLTLSQRQGIVDMLNKFDMGDCNPVATPLDPSVRLSTSDCPTTEDDARYMKTIPYAEAVGSLMYIAIATRPDIAYAVGVLSRFSSNPGTAHWKAVKHLMRYLQGTKDLKLTYAPDPNATSLFTTYSDADHAGDPDNRRSTSGFVVKIGTGCISWASRLQTIVTLSTTEAEYVSAVAAAQEMLWLQNLFKELGIPIDKMPLCIDNMSALSVAKNPEHHGRMKHLDLRFYWLRDVVHAGHITLKHVPTADMPADIMTKALSRSKVADMREMLGLRL